MKSLNKILSLVVVAALAFTSCAGPEASDGAVENAGFAYLSFEASSKSYLVNLGSTIDQEIKIYAGQNVSADTELQVSVSTTVASSAYTIPSSVTMAAGTNEATLNLSFTESGFDQANGETFDVTFTAPDGYFTGDATVSITVNVFCPSALEGSYTETNTGLPVMLTKVGGTDSQYVVSRDNYFGTAYPFTINDQCNTVTIIQSTFVDSFGIPFSGSGTTDPAAGTISMSNTLDGYYANRPFDLVKN